MLHDLTPFSEHLNLTQGEILQVRYRHHEVPNNHKTATEDRKVISSLGNYIYKCMKLRGQDVTGTVQLCVLFVLTVLYHVFYVLLCLQFVHAFLLATQFKKSQMLFHTVVQ